MVNCNEANCTCKMVNCVRHGKCCECINHHREKGSLVACMNAVAEAVKKQSRAIRHDFIFSVLRTKRKPFAGDGSERFLHRKAVYDEFDGKGVASSSLAML